MSPTVQELGPDYALAWPPALFVRESEYLLRLPEWDWNDRLEWLLTEAFESDTPRTELRSAVWDDVPMSNRTPFDIDPSPPSKAMLRFLVDHVSDLPMQMPPRPYWGGYRGNHHPQSVAEAPDFEGFTRGWVTLVHHFLDSGYYGRVAPQPCVDDDDPPIHPDVRLEQEIGGRLGVPGVWPLQPLEWDEDLACALIEVFHDIASRPRKRTYHSFSECGWHYTDYSWKAGQELYRWRVNRLFQMHRINLRLSETGEDIGRLVRVEAEGRDDLVASVAFEGDNPKQVETRQHAVALFRGRVATRDDKRSACVALAALLEERRPLLKASLFRKDEGALFQIANDFDLRHRTASQQDDYDEAFLDWIFWWYLATLDLTDHVLRRNDAG